MINWRCAVLLFLPTSALAPGRPVWPFIEASHWKIHVRASDPDAGIEKTIEGLHGEPLYNLDCHSAKFDGASLDFSGIMQCYLLPIPNHEVVSNLLSDTYRESTDWENRGRFLSDHIISPCAEYPQWGSERHFKLRGMEIILKISNVQFGGNHRRNKQPSVQSFDFFASATPLPSAKSPIAAVVRVPRPQWFYSGNGCPQYTKGRS